MKRIVLFGLMMCCLLLPAQKAAAQAEIIQIIKEGIKKVIIAVDLKIQRLQNKTIWLQNAQKAMENTVSKLHLDEITDWVEKQRKLYADYFEELRKVKLALTYYDRVKIIVRQQVQIVHEYKASWALFREDKHFTTEELDYMLAVYTGMMERCSKIIDELFLVINAFVTQMSDAKRLEIIDGVAAEVEGLLMDLKEFNAANKHLSLQRSTDRNEMEYIKKLYGL
jgi:hypothetical protein